MVNSLFFLCYITIPLTVFLPIGPWGRWKTTFSKRHWHNDVSLPILLRMLHNPVSLCRGLNMHAMRMGPGKHLKGLTLMNGLVKPEEFDYFHEVCTVVGTLQLSCSLFFQSLLSPKSLYGLPYVVTEMVSNNLDGSTWFWNLFFVGLLGGKVIGLPPVLNFGSEELKAKVVPEVLSGKKFICLAISEAQAGSDVMGLQTTAVKSEDGKEWIING